MNRSWHNEKKPSQVRDRILLAAVVFIFAAVVLRLGQVSLVNSDFYRSLASGQREMFAKLMPERGKIYVRDRKTDSLYPVATDSDTWTIYSDNRKMTDAPAAAKALAPLLADPAAEEGKTKEAVKAENEANIALKEKEIFDRLSLPGDPYEPLKSRADNDLVGRVRALNISGIDFAAEKTRLYSEKDFGGQVLGFLGFQGSDKVGHYGIEGYWNKELSGIQGYLQAERDPSGQVITTGNQALREKQDGSDIVLTIDRTLQAVACSKLKAWVAQHGAEDGSVIMLDVKTGAVMVMCNAPDFDPNEYGKENNAAVFNNQAIWGAYEPGSVMKTLTMAGAIDAGAVTPATTYDDKGEEKFGDKTIRNADREAHGIQNMVDVLDKSLNMGAIFVMRQLGIPKLRDYFEAFGFGTRTGIELDTESAGNMSAMKMRGEISAATASFGQGVTVTPLQMVTAYAALANGGKLMKPFVVSEIDHPDGTKIETLPRMVRQVISERAATLISGMLVSVVKNGHGKRAGVPGYLVAGKTGTAQIPRSDGAGYEETATIGTFVGYAPVSDPRFALLVRIDRPQDVNFAESSAAPLFGDIAAFTLQYLEVPPDDTH